VPSRDAYSSAFPRPPGVHSAGFPGKASLSPSFAKNVIPQARRPVTYSPAYSLQDSLFSHQARMRSSPRRCPNSLLPTRQKIITPKLSVKRVLGGPAFQTLVHCWARLNLDLARRSRDRFAAGGADSARGGSKPDLFARSPTLGTSREGCPEENIHTPYS